MSFLYPLGLLGLLAIPVLIIIYIIKNKYTEQVISSTYLWSLSEKFLKRKNPISMVTGIISLVLQILAVIFISFAIAHPVFVLRNAATDYLFILDGSGSMNITQSGKTRLEIGKDEIGSLIEGSAKGSYYTLVYAADTTKVIYENLDDKTRALQLLDEISNEYTASGFADAISVAQKYFDANNSVKSYLVTDKNYDSCKNVTLINVSSGEINYAISQISATITGEKLEVEGVAYSYETDADVTIALYVDGSETESATTTVSLTKLEGKKFVLDGGELSDYTSLRVVIKNSDALALDNEFILYNEKSDSSYKTLIVSDDNTFFIKAALDVVLNGNVEQVTTKEYVDNDCDGYGLYVFESYSPAEMPVSGAVWFINPVGDTENSGFSRQDDVTQGGVLVYNTSSATRVKNLVKGIVNDDSYVYKYVKCSLHRTFITAVSHDGNPLVFAGTNAYGNREVVFAFDISDSDISQSINFPILVNNLINYTFPEVVDSTAFYCGEIISVNMLANCNSLRVTSPGGNVTYLDTSIDTCDYELRETGVYTISVVIGNISRTINFYSQLPETERYTTVSESVFNIEGEAGTRKRDGKYDDIIYLFIILAVIFIADWMVYCYEQYQLR